MNIKNPVSLKINVAYQVPECFREETFNLPSLKKIKAFYFTAAIIEKSGKDTASQE